MPGINIYGLGRASKSPYVTAKSLVNIYAEQRPQGEKASLVGYRTPGLTLFTDTASTSPPRGLHSFDSKDQGFVVFSNGFYQLSGTGAITLLGRLSTYSGRVSIADNGTQIMVVDGTYGYIYTSALPAAISSITRVATLATLTTASAHGLSTGMQVTISGAAPAQYNGTYTVTVTSTTAFTYTMASDPGASASPAGTYTIAMGFIQITDPDFPSGPITVTFMAGRFVVTLTNTGRFYWSDTYDGSSWDALNFANAETNPDPNVAIWANNGQLMIFGTRTTEYWGNSGSLDQAYSLINGTATEWGLAARWSVAKFDNSVACLVKNRMGQVMVAKISGYLPQRISTPDIDSIINSYSTVNDASAYSYMLGGHPMYVINFPTAGYSWLYDGSTSIWTQLQSFGLTRHRAEFSMSFLTYTIVADYFYGKLYILSALAYTDAGDQIAATIISETIVSPDLDRFSIDKIRLDMEVGQGSSSVEKPQVGLSISRDNGNTYGAEQMRDIGPIGTYGNTVDFTRLGTARNFVFRLRVTDPVDFTLVNAMVNPTD